MNILDRDRRHLFLERQRNDGNSFIANVNIVANYIDDITKLAKNIDTLIQLAPLIDDISIIANYIDDIRLVSSKINCVCIVADNINKVCSCAENIHHIKAVSDSLLYITAIIPFKDEIKILADNLDIFKKLYSWNIPELSNKIDLNRQIVEEKTALTIRTEERTRHLLDDTQNLLDEVTLKLHDLLDLDDRMTKLCIATTDAMTKHSLRITQFQLGLKSDFSQFKELIITENQNFKDIIHNYVDSKFSIIDEKLTTLDDKIKDLNEKIDINSIIESEDVIRLEGRFIDYDIKHTYLEYRFNQHLKETDEKFENLTYISNSLISRIEYIEEENDSDLEEEMTCCLTACQDALTNIQQSIRITECYNKFKALVLNGDTLSDEMLQQYLDSLSGIEELRNNYNDLLASNQIINTNYEQLIADHEQFKSRYNDLINEHNEILDKYNSLEAKVNKILSDDGYALDDNGNIIGFQDNTDIINDFGIIESWYG